MLLRRLFVGFLIEASFRSLYVSDNYEKLYKKSLDMLEREWRSNVLENSACRRQWNQ
jgi:hypothetical protein